MNKKKDYFKKKLEGVQRMIWDNEFKREKTLMIREEVRVNYDNTKAKLDVVETQIKALPEDKKKWTDEQKRLEDTKIILDKDAERAVEQLKGLDLEVYGSLKTNQFPEGHDGIDQTLDALRELQGMIKSYITKL